MLKMLMSFLKYQTDWSSHRHLKLQRSCSHSLNLLYTLPSINYISLLAAYNDHYLYLIQFRPTTNRKVPIQLWKLTSHILLALVLCSLACLLPEIKELRLLATPPWDISNWFCTISRPSPHMLGPWIYASGSIILTSKLWSFGPTLSNKVSLDYCLHQILQQRLYYYCTRRLAVPESMVWDFSCRWFYHIL